MFETWMRAIGWLSTEITSFLLLVGGPLSYRSWFGKRRHKEVAQDLLQAFLMPLFSPEVREKLRNELVNQKIDPAEALFGREGKITKRVGAIADFAIDLFAVFSGFVVMTLSVAKYAVIAADQRAAPTRLLPVLMGGLSIVVIAAIVNQAEPGHYDPKLPPLWHLKYASFRGRDYVITVSGRTKTLLFVFRLAVALANLFLGWWVGSRILHAF